MQPQQSVCSQQFKRLFFLTWKKLFPKNHNPRVFSLRIYRCTEQEITNHQYQAVPRQSAQRRVQRKSTPPPPTPAATGTRSRAQAIKSKMPCINPRRASARAACSSQLVQLSLITSVDLDDTNERTDEIFESLKELPYLKVLAPQHFRYRPESISLYQHQQSRPIQRYLRRCVRRDQSICTTSLRQEVQGHHPPLFLLLGPWRHTTTPPPPLTVCPKLQQQKKKEHRTSQSSTPFLPPLPVQHPQRGITLPLPDSLHSSSAISSIEIPSCAANEMTLH